MPKVCFVWILLCGLGLAAASAQNSVLSQGEWYKIGVVESGIHKIDEAFLQRLGIQTTALNPANLRLYGNGGGMLPQPNRPPRPQDLVENAIFVAGESDGRFDNQDYLLFYTQGPHTIRYDTIARRFTHETNVYSDTTFYFLTVGNGPGLRVTEQASIPSSNVITTFDEYVFHEKESKNLIQSGREWYGEYFDFTTEYTFDFDLPGVLPNSTVQLSSSVIGIALANSRFQLKVNGQAIGTQKISPVSGGRYDYKGITNVSTFTTQLTSTDVPLRITMTYDKQGQNNAQGYLNFLGLQTQRALKLYGKQTAFRSLASAKVSDARFLMGGAGAQCRIWDITNPLQPNNQSYTLDADVATFGTETGRLKEFIMFTGSDFNAPVSGQKIATQDLHALAGPQLLIVTHPSFRSQAQRLADFRQSHDGLSVQVVTTAQVFNEFSSGRQDVTAIRDLVKYLYDKSNGALQYLLLFGDATYDYKNRVTSQTAFVPVYEARESLHPIFSYSSDDYFGFLDEGEGEWPENSEGDYSLEIGIGRLPVKTPQEAENLVNKLIRYATAPLGRGKWRNRITFVADDGDYNTHQMDADRLAEQLEAKYRSFNLDKIYVDAFPQVITANGQTAPKVEAAINKTVEEGSLIVNYTGHGGESGWAEERILGLNDILSWKNSDNLPLFVTATCEFGRYDNPAITSGAELILLDKKNGGIGLVTTTRPVFSNTNYLLNNAFYQAVFEPVNQQWPRLGDVVRKTKNNSLSGNVNRNFSLLGDPSMRLAYPEHEVVVTKLNGKRVEEPLDTLKALSRVTVEGETRQGSLLSDFNGTLYASVYDKASQITTGGTENNGSPSPKMTFSLRKDLLFEGTATITNGRFSFSFIVPKDINYSFGSGKISLYARNGPATADASGAFTDVVVGGSQPNVSADTQPPILRLFMNDTTFTNGGIVEREATLLTLLSDESGINLAEGGIGHAITAVLDQQKEPVILNQFYAADPDTYRKGTITYLFKELDKGKHELTLKAWDVYNNSAEASLEFIVADDARLALQEVLNYPNPFNPNVIPYTTFGFGHNRAGEDLEVTIEIFDGIGRRIKMLNAEVSAAETPTNAITWDGLSDWGTPLVKGLYVYTVTVRSQRDGSKTAKSNKLVLLN